MQSTFSLLNNLKCFLPFEFKFHNLQTIKCPCFHPLLLLWNKEGQIKVIRAYDHLKSTSHKALLNNEIFCCNFTFLVDNWRWNMMSLNCNLTLRFWFCRKKCCDKTHCFSKGSSIHILHIALLQKLAFVIFYHFMIV